MVVSWLSRARFPVSLLVLDYGGRELPMRTLRRFGDSAAFNSHEGLVWRARSLGGELLLETVPQAAPDPPEAGGGEDGGAAVAERTSHVVVDECEPRHRGVAALLARPTSGSGERHGTEQGRRDAARVSVSDLELDQLGMVSIL